MSSLANAYSQKAVFLSNVAQSDSLYLPSSDSLVFSSRSVDQNTTPSALAKVGDGWLGYIGDVNNEQGSQAVILAMVELAVEESEHTG
jgi:hypothetical protein